MVKIVFLIHDLGHGGAEKVLVNLVNNMDRSKFDITVIALFGGGVNEQYLKPDIRYKAIFKKMIPANSHLMKLLTPKQLHRLFIRDYYDIEIAYLEGVSSRIISGCVAPKTKKVSWIHCTMKSKKEMALGFRSVNEAEMAFSRFDNMVFVSKDVRKAFYDYCDICEKSVICYNTNETDMIRLRSKEECFINNQKEDVINLISVGKITIEKGYLRILNILKQLVENNYKVHWYSLGEGEYRKELEDQLSHNQLSEYFTFLGYQKNPYKYMKACDLFVCASFSEGFSTAATEALVLGIPVCTVNVSGMKEMLGSNNEYGVITDNSESALYEGITALIDHPEKLHHYRKQAELRGHSFETKETVQAVENMLLDLYKNKQIGEI